MARLGGRSPTGSTIVPSGLIEYGRPSVPDMLIASHPLKAVGTSYQRGQVGSLVPMGRVGVGTAVNWVVPAAAEQRVGSAVAREHIRSVGSASRAKSVEETLAFAPPADGTAACGLSGDEWEALLVEWVADLQALWFVGR